MQSHSLHRFRSGQDPRKQRRVRHLASSTLWRNLLNRLHGRRADDLIHFLITSPRTCLVHFPRLMFKLHHARLSTGVGAKKRLITDAWHESRTSINSRPTRGL